MIAFMISRRWAISKSIWSYKFLNINQAYTSWAIRSKSRSLSCPFCLSLLIFISWWDVIIMWPLEMVYRWYWHLLLEVRSHLSRGFHEKIFLKVKHFPTYVIASVPRIFLNYHRRNGLHFWQTDDIFFDPLKLRLSSRGKTGYHLVYFLL